MSLLRKNIGTGEFSGYLLKLGVVNKSWRERYFVLAGDRLVYFKKKDQKRAIAAIRLQWSFIRVKSP
jgi:hypothetical protein